MVGSGDTMQLDEVSKIIAFMAEAYPATFKINSKEIFIKLWHRCLQDIEYKEAEIAMMDIYMNSESNFPPRPKDVRDKVLEFRNPGTMSITAADSWGEIQQAIGAYGSLQYESTDERYNKMIESFSPITRKIVKRLGWREICTNEDPQGVVRGQFNKMFEQLIVREREQIRRPSALQHQINLLIESFDSNMGKIDKKIEPMEVAQLKKII